MQSNPATGICFPASHAVGNVHFMLDNVTMVCPEVSSPEAKATPRPAFPHASGKGVAYSPQTFLYYLAQPGLAELVLSGAVWCGAARRGAARYGVRCAVCGRLSPPKLSSPLVVVFSCSYVTQKRPLYPLCSFVL